MTVRYTCNREKSECTTLAFLVNVKTKNSYLYVTHTISIKLKETLDTMVVDCYHNLCVYRVLMKILEKKKL